MTYHNNTSHSGIKCADSGAHTETRAPSFKRSSNAIPFTRYHMSQVDQATTLGPLKNTEKCSASHEIISEMLKDGSMEVHGSMIGPSLCEHQVLKHRKQSLSEQCTNGTANRISSTGYRYICCSVALSPPTPPVDGSWSPPPCGCGAVVWGSA